MKDAAPKLAKMMRMRFLRPTPPESWSGRKMMMQICGAGWAREGQAVGRLRFCNSHSIDCFCTATWHRARSPRQRGENLTRKARMPTATSVRVSRQMRYW